MNQTPVIDMWAPFLPVPEIMAHMAENFPDQMLGYMRVFWKRKVTQNDMREGARSFELTEEQTLAALDAGNIALSLITGFDEKTSCGKTFIPNEIIAKLAEKYPARFIPFAGVDIFKGMEGVRALERWIKERKFRGLSLRPFMIGLTADDRRYYPFYAKCVELNIPVSIHMSANWTEVRTSEFGHPKVLDTVACDFPELKIIMSHGGYPWVLEAALLAWKHQNVYLELAAHRPKYFAVPGTGWEPLMQFGQKTIQDKVLYGTGWFLIGKQPADLVREFRALPVEPRVMEKWLYKNAKSLLESGRL